MVKSVKYKNKVQNRNKKVEKIIERTDIKGWTLCL